MVAVGISTVTAITMAMLKSQRNTAGHVKTTVVAIGAGILIFCTLHITMETSILGSIVAAVIGLSIVIVGATLGRNVKVVTKALENMKTFQDDEDAQHELIRLCHEHPELEEYRELAAQNLRPHLTYGELSAMRQWSKNKKFRSGPFEWLIKTLILILSIAISHTGNIVANHPLHAELVKTALMPLR